MALPAKSNGLVKGSVKIAGHATSVSLEPIFWLALRAAAAEDARAISAIITQIDEARTTNLSSAIRVWLYLRVAAPEGKRERGEV